jgi:PKD repeat protein
MNSFFQKLNFTFNRFNGGFVSLKSLLLFILIAFSFSSQAAEKKQPKYVNKMAEIQREKQATLKLGFEYAKKNYLKQNFVRIRSQESTSKKDICGSGRVSFETSVKCGVSEIVHGVRFKWKRTADESTQFLLRSESWLKSIWNWIKLVFQSSVKTRGSNRNELPDIGGLSIQTNYSGVHALYDISSYNVLTDPDGQVVSVEYDFGDGSIMLIPIDELNEVAKVSHVFPSQGTYTVKLKVFDNNNEYSEVTRDVTITNNVAPAPNFTYATQAGNTIDFTGFANDPENSIERYVWWYGDNTAPEETTTNLVSHEFPAEGAYDVTLEVWDTAGAVNFIHKKVFVAQAVPSNIPPNAIFTADTLFGEGPLKVNFDASLSTDAANGAVTSYEWNFGDYDSFFNISTDATPSHLYKGAGTYYGQLRVKDSSDNSQDFYFTVFVTSGDVKAPSIIAFQNDDSRYIDFEGASWAMTATANWDGYHWDFGDNNTHQGLGAHNSYAVDGIYPVRLVVHDVRGVRHVVKRDISVTAVNDSPIAEIGENTVSQDVGVDYSYSSEGSVDPQMNQQLTYLWNFSDGTILSGEQYNSVVHSFGVRGRYPVRLVVTNSRGISSTKFLEALVQQDSELKGVISYSPKIGKAPLLVDFDGSSSTSSNSTIVDYTWEFPDGSHSKGVSTSRLFTETGKHWIALYTLDAFGNEDVQFKKVVVFDPANEPVNNALPFATFKTRFESTDSHILTLDATDSKDDGEVVLFDWKIDDAGTAEGRRLNYTFSEGSHTVTLTVMDEWGRKNSTSRTFEVGNSVDTTLTPKLAKKHPSSSELLIFDGKSSIVPGVDVQSYSWDFGDGSQISHGETAKHVFTQAGTYVVTLTAVDTDGHVHHQTLSVNVENPEDPTLTLKIIDTDGAQEISGGGTYDALTFPLALRLSLEDTQSQRPIVAADWDFGDGQTGFGTDIQYVYHKPGTYHVTVTGYDTLGRSGTASADIFIPSDESCPSEAEYNLCLLPVNSVGNVLAFSEASWTFSHTHGADQISDVFVDKPAGWIKLVENGAADSPIEIDLADVATVNGAQIVISKDGVAKKGIDYGRSYALVMHGKSITGDNLDGDWHEIVFGAGSLTINTYEPNVNVAITSPLGNFKKYVKMGASLTKTISDLPVGTLAVEIFKDARSESRTVTLTSRSTKNVLNADISLKAIEAKHAARKNANYVKDPPSVSDVYARELAKYYTPAKPVNARDSYPPWAYGPCGDIPPFPFATGAQDIPGQNKYFTFGTGPINSSAEFNPMPSRKLHLRCNVGTSSILFAHTYWHEKLLKNECLPPGTQNLTTYNNMVARLKDDLLPITIKYAIRNVDTGDVKETFIQTSAEQLKSAEGLTNRGATYSKGIESVTGKVGYYFLEHEIELPESVENAEIKFEADGPYSYTGIYNITHCDVFGTDQPELVQIQAAIDGPRTATKNALKSLTEYGYFPAQYDGTASSPVNNGIVDAFQAKYKLTLDKKNSAPFTWLGVNVTFSYGGQLSASHIYPVTILPKSSDEILYGTIEVDAVHLADYFTMDTRFDKIVINFDAVTLSDTNVDVTPLPPKQFTAFFDAKNYLANGLVCNNGYYSFGGAGRISAFGRVQMLDMMKRYSSKLDSVGDHIAIKCNDISLPFGGDFKVWGHKSGHTRGQNVDIRYFNDFDSPLNLNQLNTGDAASPENRYDRDDASARLNDINTYLEFSNKADLIAAADESGTSGDDLKKRALVDYCLPVGLPAIDPCIVGEPITPNIVRKICQFNAGQMPLAACPDNTVAAIVAIKNYSKWITYNNEALSIISSEATKLMFSFGLRGPSSLVLPWQLLALADGRWPKWSAVDQDFEIVYKVSAGDQIEDSYISSCMSAGNSCNYLPKIRDGGDNHYDHIHWEIIAR